MTSRRLEPLKPEEIKDLWVAYAAGEFWRFCLVTKYGDRVYMHLFTHNEGCCAVSFHGAWGGYAFEWTSTGKSGARGAMDFFASCEPDYIMGKLCNEKKYRGDLTGDRVVRFVLEARRRKEIDKELARDMWNALAEYDFDSPVDLWRWEEEFQDRVESHLFYEAHLEEWGPPRDLEVLCWTVVPLFQKFIKNNFRWVRNAGNEPRP